MDFTLHPPLSSFPLALISVTALLECVQLFTKNDAIKKSCSVCLSLAAGFLVAAFLSGYGASEHADATFKISDDIISQHHTAGKFLLFAMVPCVALHFVSLFAAHGKAGFKIAYQFFLIVCVGLVFYTGYLGGQLVFKHGAGVTATLPEKSVTDLPH